MVDFQINAVGKNDSVRHSEPERTAYTGIWTAPVQYGVCGERILLCGRVPAAGKPKNLTKLIAGYEWNVKMSKSI